MGETGNHHYRHHVEVLAYTTGENQQDNLQGEVHRASTFCEPTSDGKEEEEGQTSRRSEAEDNSKTEKSACSEEVQCEEAAKSDSEREQTAAYRVCTALEHALAAFHARDSSHLGVGCRRSSSVGQPLRGFSSYFKHHKDC